MPVTGEMELIHNLEMLDKTVEKKARKATRDGASVFEEELKDVTPIGKNDHSGMTPLKEHTKKGSLRASSGDYEMPVGYDKEKGWIAHFPNSGTSKQRPQHFVERAQESSKQKVLQKFIEDLRL